MSQCMLCGIDSDYPLKEFHGKKICRDCYEYLIQEEMWKELTRSKSENNRQISNGIILDEK